MDGPRLTEERLRYHLDSNQPAREGMCLALLPLLGPFQQERPRRPKGGRDGARDIEALHNGALPVWGAVGFRNGGGTDEEARRDAESKFKADLTAALSENATLRGFVFFTNVDLTPGRIETLKRYAQDKGVTLVEVFDLHRLRHVLDSPEGLIARVQYLDIPMTPTEQAALVAKFGTQLQHAVTARFDRVEQTLSKMETFLDFQKPIVRLDYYVELKEPTASAKLGGEAIRLQVSGLHGNQETANILICNLPDHKWAGHLLVAKGLFWSVQKPENVLHFMSSRSNHSQIIVVFSEVTLTAHFQRVRITDITNLEAEAFCTDGFYPLIKRISIQANGFELIALQPDAEKEPVQLSWPESLPDKMDGKAWTKLCKEHKRNLLFQTPRRTGFSPLHYNSD